MVKNYITPIGYDVLYKQLEDLRKNKRSEIIEVIAESQKNGGDLSENSEYLQATAERDRIENKIQEISNFIENTEIVDILKFPVDGKVRFGSTVTFMDVDTEQVSTYKLVGETESDIKQGSISYKSPIGKALILKKVGDEVDLETPSGEKTLEILKVEHK